MRGVQKVAKIIAKPTSLGNHLKGPTKPQPIPQIRQAIVISTDMSTSTTTGGTCIVQFGGATQPTQVKFMGFPPLTNSVVYCMRLGNAWFVLGETVFPGWLGPWGASWGEVYIAQLTSGNYTNTSNTETTVVTLGAQQYLGGRKYEIRAMVSAQHSIASSRSLCRILNVTDTIRVNLFDTQSLFNAFTTFSAMLRFLPNTTITKEFAITAQDVAATGTLTIDGTNPGVTGAVPATIQAIDMGPISI